VIENPDPWIQEYFRGKRARGVAARISGS